MTTQSFELLMSAGPSPGQKYPLSESELIIGRDPNVDISINIPEVSRRHARLRYEMDGYIIEDLGSTNGTFVNSQRLSGPHVLRSGDEIQLGDAVTLRYKAAGFDPNATLVTPASEAKSVPPQRQKPAQPAPQPYRQPAQQAPSQRSGYAGQVPSGPSPGMVEEEKKGSPWLWASLGCLGIAICLLIVGAIAFDTMNLYCTPPFDSLFSFLYTCP
jgi:pSer/pThr/pTyr-binding forkhead associated (FHA) protein